MSKVSKLVSNEMLMKMQLDISENVIFLRNLDNQYFATQKIIDDSRKLLAEIQLHFKKPKPKPNNDLQLYA